MLLWRNRKAVFDLDSVQGGIDLQVLPSDIAQQIPGIDSIL
jgi:hypothetical protein